VAGEKQHAVAPKSSNNEDLFLGIAHKRPLGGFVMTRRRPRVDNPSRTRYSVRKALRNVEPQMLQGAEDFMNNVEEVNRYAVLLT